MSAASDARGLKRVCVNCGIRFYDFNKRPIECPNCDAEFTGEIKVKGRRGKVAVAAELEKEAKKPQPVVNDNTEEVEQEDGVVSLEDLDEGGEEELEEASLGDIEEIEEIDDDEEDLEVEVEKE